MSTIFDDFKGNADLSVFSKTNEDPKTAIRRHYLSIVGLLQYVDIINGDTEGELPEGLTETAVKGMVAHCIGDLETREAASITDGPSPEPPTPVEPTIYDMVWSFIHNEESWNEAYQEGSPLYKYYQDHPEEDLWNNTQHRAVNFNDRWYEGTIDGEEVSCGTTWAADGVQKITVDGTDYYMTIWGYDLSPYNAELFSDIALQESTGKTFEIATVKFSEECVHCWDGAINAPGAEYPWVVIDPTTPYDLSENEGMIELEIDGTKKYPWGEDYKNFKKYAIASLPHEFGEDVVQKIDPANQEATDTFDPSTLFVKGYVLVEE